MKRATSTWFFAAWCAAAGCGGTTSTQVLTGNISSTGAVAIRAISDGNVVTAGRVRSDGSFTIALPAGSTYRLEALSTTGVARIVDGSAADITFKVCAPTDPFDLGGLGDPPPPPKCDPASTDCPQPPPPCDPGTADCPQPPPKCDPASPDCQLPPSCDPGSTDCPPPPVCDPATNQDCGPPKPPLCDPNAQADCPTPPPPCADPTDPSTCKDPCGDDPSLCGCATGTDPNTGAGCWPPPCDGTDCPAPGDGIHPDHPPGDFGCKE